MAIFSTGCSLFLLLIMVQLVVGVQDDSESDDELIFAHVVSRVELNLEKKKIFSD